MRTLALVMCTALLSCSACRPERPKNLVHKLLGVNVRYVNDGGGGSVPWVTEAREVKALLGTPDILLQLIEHLDSTYLTNSRFEGHPVPVGFLCLDVLLICVDESHWQTVALDSGDDGLWATVREAYYFPPDVLVHADGKRRMLAVKAAWQQLYEKEGPGMFGPPRVSE